jgi:hypothetical protein
MGIENVTGKLSLLRVHELGSGFGPAADQLDVEVIVQLQGLPGKAFGFKLRADSRGPAREGMLALLRDGFNHGWTVSIDHDVQPGRNNSTIVRVILIKPRTGPGGGIFDGGVIDGGVITSTAKKTKAAKPKAKPKPKPRAARKKPRR